MTLEQLHWSLEPATQGAGVWLVGQSSERVEVIAAPGTPIPAAELDAETSPPRCGWRRAMWEHRKPGPLNLDRDPPSTPVLAIDTRAVLASVDARLHPSIQLILEDRLLHLEERDRRLSTSSGSGCEPIVEPDESESMQWLRGQMREAFPQRSATNSSRSLTLTTRHRRTNLATPQAFATQPPGDVRVTFRDRPMGGRELAHLLKRRVIWRVLQMFPRELVLALRTVSREHRDLGELATNNLALRQPTHEHESPQSATGMLG